MLQANEKEELLPGREMSRTRLADILEVVRVRGETGSHRRAHWPGVVEDIGAEIDASAAGVLGERSLVDLLDDHERNPDD